MFHTPDEGRDNVLKVDIPKIYDAGLSLGKNWRIALTLSGKNRKMRQFNKRFFSVMDMQMHTQCVLC